MKKSYGHGSENGDNVVNINVNDDHVDRLYYKISIILVFSSGGRASDSAPFPVATVEGGQVTFTIIIIIIFVIIVDILLQ